jgi:PilZ domain-containing protein
MVWADVLRMRHSRNPKLIMEDRVDGERRRHGRLRCEETTCCVGPVVDLSASGMRVQRRGRPVLEVGDELKVRVHVYGDDPAITLTARVVWIKRSGFRQHVYGMEFAGLSDEQKRQLSELARVVTDQAVFRCSYN